MNRRTFLRSLSATAGALALPHPAEAKLPKAKITRIRFYHPPQLNESFYQSNVVCTVETDIGITGVGEGGKKDTLEQCAGNAIGHNPFDIERIWHEMYIAWFYPPGREKIHALGAIDMALWDIKGKALDIPVHQMMGGMFRNYLECYATGPTANASGGERMSLGERAKATIEAGFRAFRMGAADSGGRAPHETVYNTHERVRAVHEAAKQVRQGMGNNGDWLIDFHQRFDFADALRACRLIEEYEPYLVEDPVRDEQALEEIPKLRLLTSVPLAHGEEWGQRWDFNKLVENKDIDYIRATLPNVGGITEMKKVAAMCETHAVGIVPHFTGPISTAALVHVLGPYSGPVLVEIGSNRRLPEHLSEGLDFKDGKIWPNDRPGLGCRLEMSRLTQIGEVTEPGKKNFYLRPDGSYTHW